MGRGAVIKNTDLELDALAKYPSPTSHPPVLNISKPQFTQLYNGANNCT